MRKTKQEVSFLSEVIMGFWDFCCDISVSQVFNSLFLSFSAIIILTIGSNLQQFSGDLKTVLLIQLSILLYLLFKGVTVRGTLGFINIILFAGAITQNLIIVGIAIKGLIFVSVIYALDLIIFKSGLFERCIRSSIKNKSRIKKR